MAGHCPWVLVWTGACYWYGAGGFVFNSPSPFFLFWGCKRGANTHEHEAHAHARPRACELGMLVRDPAGWSGGAAVWLVYATGCVLRGHPHTHTRSYTPAVIPAASTCCPAGRSLCGERPRGPRRSGPTETCATTTPPAAAANVQLRGVTAHSRRRGHDGRRRHHHRRRRRRHPHGRQDDGRAAAGGGSRRLRRRGL